MAKTVESLKAPGLKFHPSPTMKVHVGNGKVMVMNRRERRRQHLYGDRLRIEKRQPAPPLIFHSPEEMRDSLRR